MQKESREAEDGPVLVRACERSTLFDPVLACVTMALLCVTMVLACEIPHAHYPADPETTQTAHVSDLPPKHVTSDGGLLGGAVGLNTHPPHELI